MSRKSVFTIIFIFLLTTFFLGLMVYKNKPVDASSSCPSYMDPNSQACYQYLLDQYNALKTQQGTLQKQLNDEQYKQLSLEDKISYMENQITQTQRLIKSLEVEIAAHNIEIKLLEQDIQEKEDSVALMKQEISVLEGTVNKRITESYKYSHLSAFDLFLDSKSFSNVLRKTKYLITTRSQDIASLEDYSQKAVALKREEDSLSAQKADLEIKQAAILTEKDELAAQNTNLEAQVAEKNSLLAQSQAKSAELLSALRQNKTIQSQLDAEITAYVNAHMEELLRYGFIKSVRAGEVIGYVDPNTGRCSTGPHVHLGIDSNSSGTFSANVRPFPTYLTWGPASGLPLASDGWNYPYVYSNQYRVPLVGSVIMTQDYHQGYAIDLSLMGGTGNAPVYAATSGKLYRALDTGCNQNYALIVHDDGKRTIYLHLK